MILFVHHIKILIIWLKNAYDPRTSITTQNMSLRQIFFFNSEKLSLLRQYWSCQDRKDKSGILKHNWVALHIFLRNWSTESKTNFEFFLWRALLTRKSILSWKKEKVNASWQWIWDVRNCRLALEMIDDVFHCLLIVAENNGAISPRNSCLDYWSLKPLDNWVTSLFDAQSQ